VNNRQAEDLYQEILTIWAQPAPTMEEPQLWARILLNEDLLVAERTLTYLEQEMVQGNPRRFRPALTEWEHRYKLLDKARQSPRSVPPHDCSGGMVQITEPSKDSAGGSWRPCEVCNPAGYERWRNGEYRTKIEKPSQVEIDRRVGFGYLDKIRAARGMAPKERDMETVPPTIDVLEDF
jgi:hypothetical protein